MLCVQVVGSFQRAWYLPAASSLWQLLDDTVDSDVTANGFIGLDMMGSGDQNAAISKVMGGTVVDPVINTSFPTTVLPEIRRPRNPAFVSMFRAKKR